MKVLIATDFFKGNHSSFKVAALVEQGLRRAYPQAIVDSVAMADGGEGTMCTLMDYLDGEVIEKCVLGPDGIPVTAHYCIIDDGVTVIIKMAEASGITLVNKEQLNPMTTTIYGTGKLIIDALRFSTRSLSMTPRPKAFPREACSASCVPVFWRVTRSIPAIRFTNSFAGTSSRIRFPIRTVYENPFLLCPTSRRIFALRFLAVSEEAPCGIRRGYAETAKTVRKHLREARR